MTFNCLIATVALWGDYFLPLRSQKFLVLIRSISDVWKVDMNLRPPIDFELVYYPSYYQVLFKVTICQTDSNMTLNCVLCQSEFSVSPGSLIIKLSKMCFLCTYVDQMIKLQRFNVLLQIQFYNIFNNVPYIIFKRFH